MLRPPVRIGIIGGGMMSQIGHLPFYLQDRRCEVVAVAESRPSLMSALSSRYPAVRIVRDHREIVNDPDIPAVVIIAPRPAMAPVALEALQSGKHVMMEKPMAHTADQAGRLLDAALARDAILAVGFMKRYDPGIQAAHRAFTELMQGGRLGSLIFARFYNFAQVYAVPPPAHKRPEESRTERFSEWPRWPDWLPPGHQSCYEWFINSASHDVNLLNYFLSVHELKVVSACSPTPSAVVATLEYGGAPIVLEIVKSSPGVWHEGAEFVFEKGRLALAIPSPMATDQVASVIVEDNTDTARRIAVETSGGWAFERQAKGFMNALIAGEPPLTGGAEGLRDLELCECIWHRISETPLERVGQNP